MRGGEKSRIKRRNMRKKRRKRWRKRRKERMERRKKGAEGGGKRQDLLIANLYPPKLFTQASLMVVWLLDYSTGEDLYCTTQSSRGFVSLFH